MIDISRLETLLDAYFDQSLDSKECRELEQMLLGSSRARKMLHERAEQHGLLREWALREESISPLAMPREAPTRRPVWQWVAGAVAACVALILLLPNDRPVGADTADAQGVTRSEVALLAEVIGVEWAVGSDGLTAGEAIPKGPVEISKGMIRLDFYSGARVYLEGPAKLDLISPDLARLESGRLTARVPPPAQGFTILSDGLRVIDRGTEFGMSVGPDDCQVHVFDGEVEVHPEDGETPMRSLLEGDALSFHAGNSTDLRADSGAFANPRALLKVAEQARERRWQEWTASTDQVCQSPGLSIYYDFRNLEDGDSVVDNLASGALPDTEGTLVGCERVPGRWREKPALGFARTSDRVRFRLDDTSQSATMVAWIRADSLPHDHNALLSTSPGEVGEIHWKLDREGRLLLGVRAEPERAFEAWERSVSPPVITESELGRWMLVATVIDGEAGEIRHYVNGREVASTAMKRRPLIRLGRANLGNFDAALPSAPDAGFTRTFNGRIDQFAYFSRALSPEEIRAFR